MTVNAFIAIDKPAGITSFEVIRCLRRITGIRKIGHTGTLDPFATGLLICCIGSFTRLASFVEAVDKSYLATVQLGQTSTTGDTEGIIEAVEMPSTFCNYQEIARKAFELSELPVPIYSAVKISGQRAYKLARNGEEVIIPPRGVRISQFEFSCWPDGSVINHNNQFSYRCRVSKGTYIRSLSQWLAKQLGTEGYTISLRRVSIGNISIGQALNLENLTAENWQDNLLKPQDVLADVSAVDIDEAEHNIVKNGGDICNATPETQEPIAMYYKSVIVAIGELKQGKIHPKIVL